ncbi:MAG: HEPN domain-containing protein [Bacteroidota bacterium]|nr:HEPN domain-containing protein [Bacteroidota bacterium]
MKAIAQQWLNFAEKDLKSCNNNIKDISLTNIVAFHCQQTVEKCFKAIIEEKGLRLKRIHSLLKLYKTVNPLVNFDIKLDKLELLDDIYTSSRYPGDIGLMPDGEPTMKQAIEMHEYAQQIYDNTIKMFANLNEKE